MGNGPADGPDGRWPTPPDQPPPAQPPGPPAAVPAPPRPPPPRQPPPEVSGLLDRRQAARERRDFAAADAIRDQLRQAGWLVRDTPAGPGGGGGAPCGARA